MDRILELLEHYALTYGPKLLLALLALVLGLWAIALFTRWIGRMMEKRELDPSLRPFLKSLIGTLLKVLLFISVVSMLGVETTSFIAVLGAFGLAVGLALQGSLANFAGGVLILILKPFRVGDYISGAGHSGTVDRIQIFYTYLRTPQNQMISIPNGDLSNSPVVNYTAENMRRLDQVYSISYSDDIDKARSILHRLIEADERIHQDPPPEVLVDGLNDSSVDLKIRVWSTIDVFWPLHWDMQEKVKKAFDAEGVSIPFPQLDVHQR